MAVDDPKAETVEKPVPLQDESTELTEADLSAAAGGAGRPTPLRYTGPTLAGKGGGDVAMEQLDLARERLDLDS